MARPERNTVDYFPFYCDDGKKMFYIEETYGNDGFATVVKILKELAKTEYHYLDLSQNITMMFLSAKCKVSKETLICIINDLVDLGKFDSDLWAENRIIWCQDFIGSVNDAYLKRINKPLTYQGLLTLLSSKGIRKPSNLLPSSSINPQRKEKERKEEKIKEKESKKEEAFNSDLLNEIITYFEFNEERFIKQKKLILAFVDILESTGQTEHFKVQFKNYREYKQKAGYPISFPKFIGDQKERFENGAWDSDNWSKKLEEHITQENGKETKRGNYAGNGASRSAQKFDNKSGYSDI